MRVNDATASGELRSVDRLLSAALLERAEQLRHAEIEHLDLVAALVVDRDDDVVGLEVAVNDAERVRTVQGAGGLPEEARGLLDAQALHALEAPPERLSLQQLHHEVRLPLVGHPEVEHLHCVRRLQLGGDLRLGREPSLRVLLLRGRELQELDGDARVERDVPRTPDLAHAALADEGLQLVAPTQEARGFR